MKDAKCPNCGRILTENERYCHFCELEIPVFPAEKEKMDFKRAYRGFKSGIFAKIRKK
mgnify:CR=1 FL=1